MNPAPVDGGNIENLLLLRYMFVRDFAVKCGIPKSMIRRIIGTASNNGFSHTDDLKTIKPDTHFYLR